MKRHECPLCGAVVDDDVWEYHRAQEDRVLDIIKDHNPSWVMPDGNCPKAVEFYRTVILGAKDGSP